LSIGFIVVAVNWSTVLSLPLLTTADTDNNDAAIYAMYSEHLATKGFHDPGPVAGYDIGNRVRVDTFGSSALIGAVAAVSRLGSWKVTVSTLLALIVLCTYTLAVFVDTLLGGDRWLLASAAAGAASCTLLFVYVGVLFFVGQIMAMAVAPLVAVAAIRLDQAAGRRQVLGPLVSTVAIFLVMLSHYAHMLVLGAPVFLLPVLFDRRHREPWRVVRRRTVRTLAFMGAAAVIAIVVVPLWLALAIDLVRSNASVTAGFSLAGFTPPELLGFMRAIVRHPSSTRFVWSGVSIVVVMALAFVARASHRRLVHFLARFSAVVFLSYWLVWRREHGPSYRQWKWISFFQPTLVALTVTVAAVAVEQLVTARLRWRRGAALVVTGAFAVIATANTGAGEGTALRDRRKFQFVSSEHYGLAADPMLKDLTELNINVGPYWDAMWAAYFLSGKHLYLQQPSYYPTSQPRALWTLVSRVGSMHGPAVHDVNARFRLIHDDPHAPSSGVRNALDGTLAISIDADSLSSGHIGGAVSATNNGKARWLPPAASTGAVAVGVHLEDQHGRLLAEDFARVQLIDSRSFDLPPDSTTDQTFRLPALPPGHYRLVFQLVSENVAWFGAGVVEQLTVPRHPCRAPTIAASVPRSPWQC
jgi:hypothetical protein